MQLRFLIECKASTVDETVRRRSEIHFVLLLLLERLASGIIAQEQCKYKDGTAHTYKTPVCCATEYNQIGVIEQLLKAGAKTSSPNKDTDKKTPLIATTENGQMEAFELILKARLVEYYSSEFDEASLSILIEELQTISKILAEKAYVQLYRLLREEVQKLKESVNLKMQVNTKLGIFERAKQERATLIKERSKTEQATPIKELMSKFYELLIKPIRNLQEFDQLTTDIEPIVKS